MTTATRYGPLFTDLYEITMAASYYHHQVFGDATFSLYVRNYPPNRNFFVAAGLEEVLSQLEIFHFSEDELRYLDNIGLFSQDFLSFLKEFRFSGQIYALPEGTIFFPNEPILEVTAPLIEAQLLETFLLNTIGFSSLIASKAARTVHAAGGRSLVDFSFRRTQGLDAGLKVARCTYIAGFSATSNVLAGKIYGIPVSGTMAHSYVTAFDNEANAFSAYSTTFPNNSIFLIDTFDTLEGARNAVNIAKQMKSKGHSLVGVRLDSGDMTELSKKVRKILDEAGLYDVKIFASGGFDEYKIAASIFDGACIDAYGVGTIVGVSADAPYLDVVYKMVKFKDRNIRKLSTGKANLAGEKQVFRKVDSTGCYHEDIIGLRDETLAEAEPLLEKVMEAGKRLHPFPSLQTIKNRFEQNLSRLEEKYKSIQNPMMYPVRISQRLEKLQRVL